MWARALGRGRAVQPQHEGLLFLDRLVGVGPDALHEWSAGIESIAACARQCFPGRRFESWNGAQLAVHTGRQVGGEVVHPLARADPAALAARGIGVVAADGQRGSDLGVAEAHRVVVELDRHLAHARHLALGAEGADGEGLRGQRQRHADQASPRTRRWTVAIRCMSPA
jgi:hypothetical protein